MNPSTPKTPPDHRSSPSISRHRTGTRLALGAAASAVLLAVSSCAINPPPKDAAPPPTPSGTTPPDTNRPHNPDDGENPTTSPLPVPNDERPDSERPNSERPTENNTGPLVANPRNIGRVEVAAGQTVTIDNVVTDQILVHGGGRLTATNIRVNSSVVILPEKGAGTTKAHIRNALVTNGITVNTIDASGTLLWGDVEPVDIKVSDSWIRHPQGRTPEHTEALAGFGYSSGATFTNTAFIQDGPFNGTATATINWWGHNTTFDRCYFGWNGQVAAWYTVYVQGNNNVVRNSRFEAARGGYIYPDSSPPAVYTGNTDANTGTAVTR